ncbi:MAG: hypothetical protein DWQ56_10600 [Microcystis aeruginosa DA14]|uniref:Uncharacterized protein n=1 Tax=Microcystis aeruginosa DA14 TaxID=1987506 RepID=A0A3E0MDG6_MICAE|nr:MAG: hypothetical protein DWQ56_10600 [Microcystis aeruginosa DA14]
MAIITSNIEKPDSDDDSFDCIPFPFNFTFYPPPFFLKTTGFSSLLTTDYANDRIFLTLVRELIPRKPYFSIESDCLSS